MFANNTVDVMPNKKVNGKCGLSLRTWAWLMAFGNLVIFLIIGGVLLIKPNYVLNDNKLYAVFAIIVGVLNIFAGSMLVVAIIRGEEDLLLIYMLVEYLILLVLTIFSIVDIFNATGIFAILALCPFLWIGLYNIYGFYLELHNYNNDTVHAGVQEIAYNTDTNPSEAINENAVGTATV